MSDRKSNNKNNKKKRYNENQDEDFNPKFRKIRKKVCSILPFSFTYFFICS